MARFRAIPKKEELVDAEDETDSLVCEGFLGVGVVIFFELDKLLDDDLLEREIE